MLSLLLVGMFSMVVAVDRVEASTILEVFAPSTDASGSGFNSISLSSPLVNPGSGSLISSTGLLPFGSADLSLPFVVTAPVDIVLNCSAFADAIFASSDVTFQDVTTPQFLPLCVSNSIGLGTNSVTLSLKPTDFYILGAGALGGPSDEGTAFLNFSGDFSVLFLPEPSTFCLLGVPLIALGLIRKRLEKGKNIR